jgi:hypothetical protein
MRTRALFVTVGVTLLALVGATAVAPVAGAADEEGYGPTAIRGNTWYIRDALTSGAATVTAFTYGNPGDVPLMCDWNGDGTRSPGVRRGNTFYLRNANTAGIADVAAFSFGNPSDVPVCGNWNGNADDTETVGVVRGGNQFFLLNENEAAGAENPVIAFTFGNPGDVPLVGDWNGDFTYTPGVRRGIHMYLSDELVNPTANAGSFDFGNPGDIPLAGDWDEDPEFTETIGLKRGDTWFLTNGSPDSGSATANTTFSYGNPTDTGRIWFNFPVPAT